MFLTETNCRKLYSRKWQSIPYVFAHRELSSGAYIVCNTKNARAARKKGQESGRKGKGKRGEAPNVGARTCAHRTYNLLRCWISLTGSAGERGGKRPRERGELFGTESFSSSALLFFSSLPFFVSFSRTKKDAPHASAEGHNGIRNFFLGL